MICHVKISEEIVEEAVIRKYVVGTDISTKYLYEEVPSGAEWYAPANKLIFFFSPLEGTRVSGLGTFCIVTQSALTNGAISSQANGFFRSFLKFSGYNGGIVEGVARKPVFLYIHNGCAELRDATRLVGRDTWETEDLIKFRRVEKGKRRRGIR